MSNATENGGRLDKTKPATVRSFLFGPCSEMILDELVEDESTHSAFGYWYQCQKFIREHGHRDLSNLTTKQRGWVRRILDDLIEEARKR